MNTNFEKAVIYTATYEQVKELGKNHQNRMINHGHVNQIKKAIEAGDFPYMPPITVNEVTKNIIDGQHRAAAFIQSVKSGILPENSKLEIKLVSIPQEKEIEAICNANVNSKNWSVDDFIDSFTRGDNPRAMHYSKLQEFCDNHTLLHKEHTSKITGDPQNFKRNYRYAVAMLKGKDGKKMLKNGMLELNDVDIALGHMIHNEVESILEILNIKNGPITESFAIVWYDYRNKLSFSTWKKLFKKYKKKFNIEINKKNGMDLESLIKIMLYDNEHNE